MPIPPAAFRLSAQTKYQIEGMGCERFASLNEVNSRAILEASKNAKCTFNHRWSEHIFNWINHMEQSASRCLVPATGSQWYYIHCDRRLLADQVA